MKKKRKKISKAYAQAIKINKDLNREFLLALQKDK